MRWNCRRATWFLASLRSISGKPTILARLRYVHRHVAIRLRATVRFIAHTG